MAALNLNHEEITELLVVLNTALYDTNEMIRLSHDTEEIDAYKEHRARIRKWITRLSKLIGNENE
jgi:hypothetical protein